MYPERSRTPAVQVRPGGVSPRPLDDMGLAQVVDMLDEVQLDQPVEAGVLVQRASSAQKYCRVSLAVRSPLSITP